MNTTIDEQLFTEQVLELVTSIKKRDGVNIEAEQVVSANVISGDSNIIGPICITNGNTSPPVVIAGGIQKKYPDDIPINSSENNEDIGVAIEIAGKEIFDFNQEKEAGKVKSLKIKNIIIDALCPSLLKTSDDVFEIAKSSTPVLLTLSLSGTISLPIQPVFFAAAAILLTRSSIAAICKDTHRSTPK